MIRIENTSGNRFPVGTRISLTENPAGPGEPASGRAAVVFHPATPGTVPPSPFGTLVFMAESEFEHYTRDAEFWSTKGANGPSKGKAPVLTIEQVTADDARREIEGLLPDRPARPEAEVTPEAKHELGTIAVQKAA